MNFFTFLLLILFPTEKVGKRLGYLKSLQIAHHCGLMANTKKSLPLLRKSKMKISVWLKFRLLFVPMRKYFEVEKRILVPFIRVTSEKVVFPDSRYDQFVNFLNNTYGN